MSAKKRLLLIDGHALLYRAYHAIPALTSPSGEPTNATFGFANMLLKAIQDYQPDYVVATFDAGETFRHQEYAEYKANRAHMPDDLRPQVERVRQLLHALAIPTYELEGYEADDLLGSLAARAAKQGLETIIVTGDSDTFQLISPEVRVLTPKRSLGEVQLYDEQAVRERYGLEPQQLVDFKALMGDPSDNIPGVAGIGEKTAAALLQQFGSLEGIYAHLDEVKPARVRQALEQHRDAALLSKRLVTIVRDLAVPLDLGASVWGRYDRAKVMELLRELGFRALVERIPQPSAQPAAGQLALFGQEGTPSAVAAQPAAPEPACTYYAVDTAPALEQLVAKLQRAERFALDTETTSVDPLRAKLVGISLAMQPKEAYYVPVGHDRRLNVGQQLPLELVRERLGPLLADGRIGKVCHNAKFDMAILALHGMPLEGLQCDTLIAAWLLEPEGRSLSLKGQAWQRLGVEMTPIEEVIGKGNKQVHMDQVPISQVVPYACADADMTLRLQGILEPELKARDQWRLFAELEMPLVPILLAMELHGMVLDTDYLEAMSRQLGQRLEELRAQIYEQAGHPFNINSPQQLGTVLFEELKLPRGRRTQTGYSTDASVMESLQGKHPIVGLILEHRQLEKLKSTYVDALPALINPRTGRVHTSFNQTGTSTGRLSSSEPNLQNIPVRTELGRLVRGAFVAPPGHWLLSCDYSQVELRLLAHLSEDPELLGAFQRGEDVHASTAAAIFGVPLAAVTKEQRGLAKAINFGLMYGMSDYGLSSRTDLSVSEARQFIENYFQRFSRVKEYLEGTVRLAYEKGYVETILGRRRYFPELRAGQAVNQNVRRAAERAAVNMPIQGSAADIIKLAMIQLDRRLREQGLRACMVLQVHDELVLEVPDEELETARNLVVETMENAYPLRVALKVEAAIGKNWMEMK